jgi:hypothetical protein
VATEITSITFVDPPRPASGDGDILVNAFGGTNKTQVRLSFKNNEIVDVSGGGVDIIDITIAEPLGIVTCEKCARDSQTGQTVCWPVPC